jgi:hypothetical protein
LTAIFQLAQQIDLGILDLCTSSLIEEIDQLYALTLGVKKVNSENVFVEPSSLSKICWSVLQIRGESENGYYNHYIIPWSGLVDLPFNH